MVPSMRRTRPDLIVPIHDRRKHRRILTLRNAAWTLGAIVVIFIGLTVYSELRRPTPGQYGGLMQRQAPPPLAVAPHVEPIREGAAVAEQSSADPMLMTPAARAQEFLAVQSPAPRVSTAPPAAPVALQPTQAEATPGQASLNGTHGRVAIVGDGKGGVTIVQTSSAPLPKLSGGIFRPQ
jgi:hypothetical protein